MLRCRWLRWRRSRRTIRPPAWLRSDVGAPMPIISVRDFGYLSGPVGAETFHAWPDAEARQRLLMEREGMSDDEYARTAALARAGHG
jgi:hypothetical protein